MNAQDRGAEPAYPTVVHEYRRRDNLGGMFVLESSTGHAGLTKREEFAMAVCRVCLQTDRETMRSRIVQQAWPWLSPTFY